MKYNSSVCFYLVPSNFLTNLEDVLYKVHPIASVVLDRSTSKAETSSGPNKTALGSCSENTQHFLLLFVSSCHRHAGLLNGNNHVSFSPSRSPGSMDFECVRIYNVLPKATSRSVANP